MWPQVVATSGGLPTSKVYIERCNENEKETDMSVENLEELLIDELKDLYSAEKQIVRTLPKLAKAATSPDLSEALLSHLEETRGQVQRLEKISELIGKKL